MKQEDIQKFFESIGKGGITVAGDLVLEKKVEYEVNVEEGGIGIQIVNGNRKEIEESEVTEELPTREEMIQAVKATCRMGLWWSSRSWAVVYRVYQMKGYMANISQFVREVKSWEVTTGYECSYDAVQKPIASGVFGGNTDKWEAQGAQGQAVKLAEALLEELRKN